MNSIRISTFPGREIQLNNNTYLYFGGTAYLGMQSLPEFKSLFIEHVKSYGTNYGASRISNVQIEMYEKAERFLNNWVDCASSITLSSGYLAGQLLATYMEQQNYELYFKANTHSALYARTQEVFEDYNSLKLLMENKIKNGITNTPVLFLDTIDFSQDSFPGFEGLKLLPLDSCILVADDSHGIGVVGPNGSGSYQALRQLEPKELLVCCSLGKSMGLQAGAIFGTAERITELRSTSLFAGASPASAAYLAALIDADTLYASQRSRLLDLTDQFREMLLVTDRFSYLDEYPVFVYQDKKLTQFLFEHGVCVTDFQYPTDKDSWQSRIVLSASHLKKDIQKLAELINLFYS
ncbi:MAG: aminotransferase class I/II-fold pyridoxal phosphate-dependent enzyme [Flavobacteriaceae bacterium]